MILVCSFLYFLENKKKNRFVECVLPTTYFLFQNDNNFKRKRNGKLFNFSENNLYIFLRFLAFTFLLFCFSFISIYISISKCSNVLQCNNWLIDICTLDMNINDVTVSWQDISDTERTALLNKRTYFIDRCPYSIMNIFLSFFLACPPRSKAKVPPVGDFLTESICSINQLSISSRAKPPIESIPVYSAYANRR